MRSRGISHIRRRWPKGTWMKLRSKDTLRALMEQCGVSHRNLARYVECHHSFISHLTSGRRSTCEPQTARRIAEFLQVQQSTLFDAEVPSNKQMIAKQQVAA